MLVSSLSSGSEWLTLVTYMLLHKGWPHVTTNMIGRWAFGRFAEPIMGSRRFLITYLVSGVFTGLVIAFLVPGWTTPAVGASGAICGMLGAFLAARLPPWPVYDRRSLTMLGAEAGCGLCVLSWLILRSPPQVPGRLTSLMWHVIPFFAGWVYIRVPRLFAGGEAGVLSSE
jgi:membrane associated rhomboid family serine protease